MLDDELGVRRAIVEVTEARVVPAREIDLQFARDEGEGFESGARTGTRRTSASSSARSTPDTLIDAVRFRVVERL